MKSMTAKPVMIIPETVPGWGIDADSNNDPTYPMRERSEVAHEGYTWKRPQQQRQTVEVLHSNERPSLSATFGTATPPHGLSGSLRRFAFRYSESSYGHWLPLMLADRVDSLEGTVRDVVGGQVPNVFAERGWNAEWKHNRTSLVTRTVAGAVVLGALAVGLMYLTRRPEPPRRRDVRRPGVRSPLAASVPMNPS